MLTSSPLLCAEKHRGFAFVQFEDPRDAADCIDNMDNAELFGRVLKVNVAKPSAAAISSPTPPTRTEGCGGFREGLFMGSPPGPVAGGAPRV